MAVDAGIFRSRSGTGAQSIPLPFDPVAMLAWSNVLVGAIPQTAGYWFWHQGIVTSALQVALGSSEDDGVAASEVNRHYVEGSFIAARNNAGTLEMAATATLGTREVALNWTTNNFADTVYHYLAFGGEGVSAQLLSTLKGVGNTGANETVTGGTIGTPDCMIVCPTYDVVGNPTSDSSDSGAPIPAMGWSDGVRQGAAAIMIEDNQPTMDTWRYQRDDHCLLALNPGNGTIRFASRIVGFTPTGLIHNWAAVDALSDLRLYWLLLKGIRAQAFSFTQPAATGIQSHAISFPPRACLIQSTYLTAQGGAIAINDPAQANARYMLGVADTEAQGCATTCSSDGTADSVNARTQTDQHLIRVVLEAEPASSSTVLASATRSAFTPTGIDLNWDVTDGAARQFLGLAFGDSEDASGLDWLPRSQTSMGTPKGGGVPSGMTPPEMAA